MCRNNGSAEIAGMDIAELDMDLTDIFAGADIAARDVDRVVNDGRILPTTSLTTMAYKQHMPTHTQYY